MGTYSQSEGRSSAAGSAVATVAAGAFFRRFRPPRGYADFTVADITEKSKRWKLEQLDAALEYERAHANRKGAIAALESAIAAKQEKEG